MNKKCISKFCTGCTDVMFNLPRNMEKLKQWMSKINLNEINELPLTTRKNMRICSRHFSRKHFSDDSMSKLNRNAVPDQCLSVSEHTTIKSDTHTIINTNNSGRVQEYDSEITKLCEVLNKSPALPSTSHQSPTPEPAKRVVPCPKHSKKRTSIKKSKKIVKLSKLRKLNYREVKFIESLDRLS